MLNELRKQHHDLSKKGLEAVHLEEEMISIVHNQLTSVQKHELKMLEGRMKEAEMLTKQLTLKLKHMKCKSNLCSS